MDSDGEYIENLSEDDAIIAPGRRQDSQYGTRSSRLSIDFPYDRTAHYLLAGPARGKQAQTGRSKERWEDIQISWDLVTEGADGSLSGTVEGLLEAGKRKR